MDWESKYPPQSFGSWRMWRDPMEALRLDIYYIEERPSAIYDDTRGNIRAPVSDRLREVLKHIITHDMLQSTFKMLTSQEAVYRVWLGKDGEVEVLRIGFDTVDDPDCGAYSSVHDLPQWLQDKIAVLSMLSAKPPTEDVVGVGRRIHEYVYWVYRS